VLQLRRCEKTRLNELSYGIKICIDFFRFVTIHACDRQTDEQAEFSFIAAWQR